MASAPVRAIRSAGAWRTVLLILVAAGTPLVAVSGTKAPRMTRVSVSPDGSEGNGQCNYPAISANGRFVAFESTADNLVPGDLNSVSDIFVRDTKTGITTRVSVDSLGGEGNGNSTFPTISANGRFVAFASGSTDLVPGDTNGTYDIFVHDRKTGGTTRVSVSSDGTQTNDDTDYDAHISANGRFVAFSSGASNLVPGDGNGKQDFFVHDTKTRRTTRASVDSAGVEANSACLYGSISATGRYVAFASRADNLVAGDTNAGDDIFVHDMKSGLTTRVSVTTNGEQANGQCYDAAISANGRVVSFTSDSTSLAPSGPVGAPQIYVHDSGRGETRRISAFTPDVEGNGRSSAATMTASGRFVAFVSDADNVVSGDVGGQMDVFVYDMKSRTHTRASVNLLGEEGNDRSFDVVTSGNGRVAAFVSRATNLVPGDVNGQDDVFVRTLE